MLGEIVVRVKYGPTEFVPRHTVKPVSLVELSVHTRSIREALMAVALRPLGAGRGGIVDAKTNFTPSAMATPLSSATLSITRTLPDVPEINGNRPSKVQLPALVRWLAYTVVEPPL